jgi:hypothetical protein
MTDETPAPSEAEMIAHVADLVVGAYVAFRPFDYRAIARSIRAEILKTSDPVGLTAMGQMLRLVEAGANLTDVVTLVLAEQGEEKNAATRQ